MAARFERRTLLGAVLLVADLSIGITQLGTFPGMLFGGCTDVGGPEGQGQGVSIIGVQDSNLLYTPDGVNECSTPLPAVLAPIGHPAAGGGLVLSGREGPILPPLNVAVVELTTSLGDASESPTSG